MEMDFSKIDRGKQEVSHLNSEAIQKKWQKKWEESKIFEVGESSKKKKFYVLDMFPYPSGAGLHIGHAFVFSLGDIFARFKRMQGFNVLYPIGYDSLGLPAENAAIKVGTHPAEYTKKSIANFMKQQKAMGWSYDWSRMVSTSDPKYYKWDQWIFLKMLEKGIAYRKKSAVNWCPKCQSVLANEQVIGGKCWRHEDCDVEIKHLEQWFFKITNYAERLLNGLENVDWPERAKLMQKNWIGKSHGTEILFEINGNKWPIFTTRPDTIFGVTFMVVSAQHPRLMELVTDKQKKDVEKFLKKLKSVSEKELADMEKEGVFTGSYAINPMTKEKVPVWAGNFVVADYGSGMVMAVPAHDQRDFEFAEKYEIPVKIVIQPDEHLAPERMTEAYTGDGKLVNSENFDGLHNEEAKEHISIYLKEKKLGKKVVNYKLRDWLISRQRYWGTPIPIIYCDKCGIVPVPEKDLPVELPKEVEFGKGNPLATNKKWMNAKCPKCGGNGRRETDTMDTFVNSSWYYLRYSDPKNDRKIFDTKKANYWAPIDQYIGGPEHITMHLIYLRFYTKFLKDLGLLKFEEPALRYFTQGIVHASDGEKMSKSKGNVIEPLDMINKYGADSLRLFLVSIASPDKDFNWDDKGIQGTFNFISKIYNYFENFESAKVSPKIESKLNKAIKEITDYVQDFKHNLAVIKIRSLFESFADGDVDKKSAEAFLKLLHIYCPFATEELWEKFGNKTFISLEKWPVADEKKINEKLEEQEKAIDSLVNDINNVLRIVGEKNKVSIYVIPKEKEIYEDAIEMIGKRTNLEVSIYSVNDKDKYDPEGKSKKAKLGKPAIYLE
ncbi:MAG: leucine--tRNA ligase [Candidatus Nanoarchaeia archaeon]|nr:leucine--tRNA ligase [Candidatus Nanoarchaeia archaeon]MDD5358030.1 leucine--tRNA ligase [Candidatus Nanoarchaeia archaeon]MDD5588949.1 leucine--tRNA ligase [Candidatus Nanoarchaeia archaeon]